MCLFIYKLYKAMVEGDPDMGQQPIIWLIFPPPHGMEIKTIKPEASGEG